MFFVSFNDSIMVKIPSKNGYMHAENGTNTKNSICHLYLTILEFRIKTGRIMLERIKGNNSIGHMSMKNRWKNIPRNAIKTSVEMHFNNSVLMVQGLSIVADNNDSSICF